MALFTQFVRQSIIQWTNDTKQSAHKVFFQSEFGVSNDCHIECVSEQKQDP